jgi:general secretion pathway protein I
MKKNCITCQLLCRRRRHWIPKLRFRRTKALAGPLAPSNRQRGFTLLEIVLSLAILAGALAALGEVLRLADQNAQMSRDETQAQILAASVMDELASGARSIASVNNVPFDYNTEPPWLYSIDLEQTDHDELILVRVRVAQQLDARKQPARFEIVRWMPNPDFVAAATSQDSSSSGSNSSSKTSAGQTTGGGSGGSSTKSGGSQKGGSR